MFGNVRRRLLGAALALSVGGVGCAGVMSEEDLAVSEAASYQALTQEDGDVTADVPEESPAEAAAEDVPVLTGEAGREGVCDFSDERAQVLARYDADKNGRLSRAELQALKADLGDHPRLGMVMRQRARALLRLRWVFDENGDKQLSADERTALVDAMQARCERLRQKALEKFDANKDGSLDETEKAALKAAVLARVQERRRQLMTQYDANANGKLDEAELAKFKADRQEARQTRRAQVLAQYDTDGDGKLSATEAAALKAAIKQRIIEGADAE